MANSLGNYNEVFFAQEALIQLENALGIAGRIHRGYADDIAAKGDTIQIRGPGTFTVQDAPSTPQDLDTRKIPLTLNQWKEVKFKLTDKDLSLSADQIISDHIRPAAYAIANYMDQVLAALTFSVPYVTVQAASSFALSDLTAARAAMFDRGVPLDDSALLHGMVSGTYEAYMLNLLSAAGMQPNQQDSSIRKGTIGELFGINWFANQNVQSYTSGNMTDKVGAVVGATAKGSLVVSIGSIDTTGVVKKGDYFTIAGHEKPYAVTADVTASAGTAANVPIWPALQAAVAGGEVVTITQNNAGVAKTSNLLFHRNFAALGTARLTTLGAQLGGARMSSISDPKTNLSLRARMWYEGTASSVFVALDVLFGYTMLDESLAQRLQQF